MNADNKFSQERVIKLSNNSKIATAYIGAAIAITAISISPASADILSVSGLDIGSGRFWEWVMRQFG